MFFFTFSLLVIIKSMSKRMLHTKMKISALYLSQNFITYNSQHSSSPFLGSAVEMLGLATSCKGAVKTIFTQGGKESLVEEDNK